MKIAIASPGRFHALDLARELAALGHEVSFYSYVPKSRAVRFGLPPSCHRSLLPIALPFLALMRLAPQRLRIMLDHALLGVLDRTIAARLERCDVFIGMSGLALESATKAKRKYNAKVIIERGSRHILSQKEILDGLRAKGHEVGSIPLRFTRREIKGYELADFVSIPSRHVERSFLERGYPAAKLFRNPYGVDLTMFQAAPAGSRHREPTILFVGTWSYRKGADILVDAWRRLRTKGVRLLHVGSVLDAPLPEEAGFEHVEAVPQWELPAYYARGDVFVLASREEGLSLVLAQALACGLHVVCTDRTGGEDLTDFISTKSAVQVVPHEDPISLERAIVRALDASRGEERLPAISPESYERLSWRGYGRRYHDFLTWISKTA